MLRHTLGVAAVVASFVTTYSAPAGAETAAICASMLKPLERPALGTTAASGLRVWTLRAGSGASPATGQLVTLQYTLCLTDGTEVDTSLERGEGFSFRLGSDRVIRGFEEAVRSMHVGDEAVVFIPSALGYGAHGAGAIIPPNANLVFLIELLSAQ